MRMPLAALAEPTRAAEPAAAPGGPSSRGTAVESHPGLLSADADRAAVVDTAAPVTGEAGGGLETPFPACLRVPSGPGANCERVALAAGSSLDAA